MMKKVRLFDIPKELQEEYLIGPEVEAIAQMDGAGSLFIFENNKGKTLTLHTIDLAPHYVGVKELDPSLG